MQRQSQGKHQNIHKKLIDRILSKIDKKSEEPNITLTPLSSFANNVYKVQVGDDQNQLLKNQIFLFKIFRQYLDQFSNKNIQNAVVTKLSELNQYPKVFYASPQYRIQSFVISKSPTTQAATLPLLLTLTKKLSDLTHIFKNFSPTPQYHNQRKILPMFSTFQAIVKICLKTTPVSFQKLKPLLEHVLSPQIRQNLQKIVPQVLVPTHNDCHFHNVLLQTATSQSEPQKMYLIDYQFFSMNYRGYELGNFFNEFATDYEKFQIKEELEMKQEWKDQIIQKYYAGLEEKIQGKDEGKGSEKSNAGVKERNREVQIGRMLSHLFWLFIGVKQVEDPKIKIDMKYYVQRRYEQFMKIYNKFVNK